jgi:hypothetical protein
VAAHVARARIEDPSIRPYNCHDKGSVGPGFGRSWTKLGRTLHSSFEKIYFALDESAQRRPIKALELWIPDFNDNSFDLNVLKFYQKCLLGMSLDHLLKRIAEFAYDELAVSTSHLSCWLSKIGGATLDAPDSTHGT